VTTPVGRPSPRANSSCRILGGVVRTARPHEGTHVLAPQSTLTCRTRLTVFASVKFVPRAEQPRDRDAPCQRRQHSRGSPV